MTTIEVTRDDIEGGVCGAPRLCMLAAAIRRHVKRGVEVWVYPRYPQDEGGPRVAFDSPGGIETAVVLPAAANRAALRFDETKDADDPGAARARIEPLAFDLDIPAEFLARPLGRAEPATPTRGDETTMSDKQALLVCVYETNNAVACAAIGDKAKELLGWIGSGQQLDCFGNFYPEPPGDCGKYVWEGEITVTAWGARGAEEADDMDVDFEGSWRPAAEEDFARFNVTTTP